MAGLVCLVLTCERPEAEIRELEQRLPPTRQSCRSHLRLRDRDGAAVPLGVPGEEPPPRADTEKEEALWAIDLPRGSSLAYERLEELLEILREATRTGVRWVLLGWRRELSLWRQEACRVRDPLQDPVDAFWLTLPLPRGALLRRIPAASGAGGAPAGADAVLPEVAVCAALASRQKILQPAAPFLRLQGPVPPTAAGREEWIRRRDRALSTRRHLHRWPLRRELELRRHGRWLLAWTAAEQHHWEEALTWWRRGALQLPGSPRRHWFEAMKLFCRAQEAQPGPLSVADLIRQPLWRRQGLDCLTPADAPPP